MKMLLSMQKKGHDVHKDLEKLRQQQEENLHPAVIHLYEEANEDCLHDDGNLSPPNTALCDFNNSNTLPPCNIPVLNNYNTSTTVYHM